MKLLLTGATGFLGSHLLRELLNHGHEVTALYRSPLSGRRIEDVVKRVVWFPIDDIQNRSAELFSEIDVVIHTAGSYGRNGESIEQLLEANLVFPLRLLEGLITAHVKDFINTNSALPREFNAYSRSKAQFAEWGKYYAEKNAITFTDLRLEHMYGPGDDPVKFTDHVVETCLSNREELLLTSGEQRRDFVYISDVTNAYCCVINSLGDGFKGYREVQVGSGAAVSVREFVETVHRLTNSRTALRFGAVPYRENEVMLSVADTRELARLGWSSKVGLQKGLEEIIRSKRACNY